MGERPGSSQMVRPLRVWVARTTQDSGTILCFTLWTALCRISLLVYSVVERLSIGQRSPFYRRCPVPTVCSTILSDFKRQFCDSFLPPAPALEPRHAASFTIENRWRQPDSCAT
jgi:hypothetical protein